MKHSLKAALCSLVALFLFLNSAALAAQPVNANLYMSQDGPQNQYVNAGVTVGDTLYLLVQDSLTSVVNLERWTPGMDKPEVMLADVKNSPEDSTESGKSITYLFTDGKALYGMGGESGKVLLLQGDHADAELCTLDLSSFMKTDGDAKYLDLGETLSLFAQDSILYMLTRNYDDSGNDEIRQLARFNLQTGALIKKEPAATIRELSRYKDGKLLAFTWDDQQIATSDRERTPYVIAEYDPETGKTTDIALAKSESDTGLCYRQSNNTAYFASAASIYSLPNMQGELKLSAYMPNTLYSGSSRGSVLSVLESGVIAACSYNGVNIRALDMPGIENGALTIEGEYGSNQHNAVIAAHPELNITLSSDYHSSLEEYTAAMVSGENSLDIVLLNSSYAPLERLINKGYAAELSGYPEIASIAAQMDERFLAPLTRDGKLYGLPISVSGSVMGYNAETMKTLGLAQADMPTTIWELLDFVENYQYDYGEEHPELNLFQDVNYRATLFNYVMDQYIAYQMKTAGIVTFDTELYRKLLDKLDGIDFSEMDPYARLGEELYQNNDEMSEYWSKAALFSSYTNITPSSLSSSGGDNSFMPLLLPLDKGMEPIVSVTEEVLIINPRSTHMDQAVIYLSEYAKHLRPESDDIILHTDRNEGVPNEWYERTKQDCERGIAETTKQLETASEENKAELRAMLESQQQNLADNENHRMSVTVEAIARFRSEIAPYLYVVGQTPLTDWSSTSAGELNTQLQMYMEKAITTDQFVKEIDKRVKLMMLEDQ
ncbi:MAG: extracellular solute-binding protein [Clostridia bacterium]